MINANNTEEGITKPKNVIKVLLPQCFEKDEFKRNGKKDKKVRYTETMTAPEIMSFINVKDLLEKDMELQRFKQKIAERGSAIS